ncbi:MAG: hypothetical protein WC796_01755 [Candidatus Pacearchaeota archaeon]|jgi:hypothetical protein
MNKVIGYVLAIVGIVLLALTVNPIKNNSFVVKILPFIQSVPNYVLIGIGLVLVILAFLIIRQFGGDSKQPVEVPIYQGKNVVGFRRMGKK